MPAVAFSRSLALSGRPVHSKICLGQQQSRLFRAPLAPQLRRFNRPVFALAQDSQQLSESKSLAKAVSVDAESSEPLYLEPFLRTFVLGVGSGALLEAAHVALQVLTGSFPGMADFSPLLFADHAVSFASWVALYSVEVYFIMAALKRCNFDRKAAASAYRGISTLPKRMLPLRMNLVKELVLARSRLRRGDGLALVGASPAEAAFTSAAEPAALPAAASPAAVVELPQALASAALADEVASGPKVVTVPRTLPKTTRSSIAPAPGLLRRPAPTPPGTEQPQQQPQPLPGRAPAVEPSVARRQKELLDRQGYLTNFWYAAAISEKVKDKPVKVEMCGKELVLFRGENGQVHCVDNACPHRGAPLSDGWVGKNEGHDCIVCPYHGWAFDANGALRDVPAASNKGEWPRRPLIDAYDVVEKGGFVWLFFGSKALPMEERPPIPYVPELDDPNWKAVYEEMEFECNHFGVFENAFDFAHIHYLHSDSFGSQDKPEVRDIQSTVDEWGVNATFTIHNKPVNAFWALFQVPEVKVTARAFLPSTSMVTFTLGNGLSFTTFVNTVPINANKSINRFALIRNLSFDKTGIFNAGIWDGMARDAMKKILSEDKAMVEQLNYEQLPTEYSVRADGPQVMFRKLRQQYVDLGYSVPPETVLPPFANRISRRAPGSSAPSRAEQQQQQWQ